jgi:hypothetical protein
MVTMSVKLSLLFSEDMVEAEFDMNDALNLFSFLAFSSYLSIIFK